MTAASRFSTIAIDAPWHEPGGHNRGSDDQYPTLDRAGILEAIVTARDPRGASVWRPADDCIAFVWTTMTSLVDGLWLVDALGFRYVTHGVWVKKKRDGSGYDISLGQYFRGAHELYLLGVRGSGFSVRSAARDIPSVIEAPTPRANGDTGKRVHSKKPPAFYEMVERRCVGARLEMFARDVRPGWVGWGRDYPAIEGDTTP